MINLSQRDLRWANNKLGSSSLTLGKFGCTTTCISMLSDYFKCYKSPSEIAAKKDWYTKDGLINWPKLKFPKMKWVWREHGRNDAKILESIKDKNKAVILQVNNGAHWILAKRKALFSNDYVCVDPWDGKECLAIKKYHNITGSSHFSS